MLEYENIYNGKVSEQKEIVKIFERNLKKREILTMIPCVLSVEPLSAMTAMGKQIKIIGASYEHF